MALPEIIDWAIYDSLRPEEAQLKLAHINDSKWVSAASPYFVCVSLVVLAVTMRFLSRRIGRTKYGADDWTMVLGLVLVIAHSTACLLATSAYKGPYHVILTKDNESFIFAKYVLAGETLYALSIGVVKISTLLLFARIFPGQKFKRTLWALGIFISTYSAFVIITTIFQCRPFNSVCDPTMKAECEDISKVWIVTANLNVSTYLLLLCLPLPQLSESKMRRKTECQVIGIFSIGSFATAVSIYRIPQLRGLSSYSYYPTWADAEPSPCSVVEIAAATLGSCAITYRPLFDWAFGILPSRSGTEDRTSLAGGTNSSCFTAGIGVDSNIDYDIKMQALNVFHPYLSASIHNSQKSQLQGGSCQTPDSTNV